MANMYLRNNISSWFIRNSRVRTIIGKSFSEALILGSANPQYDKRFTSSVHENYKLRTRGETACCVQKLF